MSESDERPPEAVNGLVLLDSRWWSTPQLVDLGAGAQQCHIGLVLARDPYLGLKCYIGVGNGRERTSDQAWIAAAGARVPASIAAPVFPLYADQPWCEDDRR